MARQEDQIRVKVDAQGADAGRIVGGEPGRIRRSADAGAESTLAGRERRGGQGEFRNTCGVCSAKINYAFARRADIPGVCGQCLDRYRKKIRGELSDEVLGGMHPKSRTRIVHYFPKRSFVKGMAIGLLLGFLGAVLTNLYGNGTFDRASAETERAIDGGMVWARKAAVAIKAKLGS